MPRPTATRPPAVSAAPPAMNGAGGGPRRSDQMPIAIGTPKPATAFTVITAPISDGRVVDPLEQHRQVGGGERAARARPHRGERERDEQRAPARAGEAARAGHRGARTAATAQRRSRRRSRIGARPRAGGRGSTLTVAVVVPSGTASATSGRASVIRARVAARAARPRRPRCPPRWAAARRRSSRVRRGARPEDDRVQAPVGRVGAGSDQEPVGEVGEVREEQLRRVGRIDLRAAESPGRAAGRA